MTAEAVEFSLSRDPDGDVGVELLIDRHNLVSISIGPVGHINWAGICDGVSAHGPGSGKELGLFLFKLLNRHVRDEE